MHIITIDLTDNTLNYKGTYAKLDDSDNGCYSLCSGLGDVDRMWVEYSIVKLGKVITLTIYDNSTSSTKS